MDNEIKKYCKSCKFYSKLGCQSTLICRDGNRFIVADVQPNSYVNAIYAELAKLYGSPCSNFSHQDEYMLENGKCDDCCVDIPDKECWKRYFKRKFAKED